MEGVDDAVLEVLEQIFCDERTVCLICFRPLVPHCLFCNYECEAVAKDPSASAYSNDR
jgi:hypothetical protein